MKSLLLKVLVIAAICMPDLRAGRGAVLADWNFHEGAAEANSGRSFRYAAADNLPPVITSNGGGSAATQSVSENTLAVTTVTAVDEDIPAQTITYSVSGGEDQNLFTINSSTGLLTFKASPDYENPHDNGKDNQYQIQVTATDNGLGNLSDVQDLTITVTNVNEPPVITSDGGGETAGLTIPENSSPVTTITALDPESSSEILTFSISGGQDQKYFKINNSTGALSFISPPDFENPLDAGKNNHYEVQVMVRDNGTGNLTDIQDLTINVTNINEPPVLTDLSKTGPEDSPIGFTVSDFSHAFSDGEGNALVSVRIVTLPASGTLYLSGNPVAAGTEITASRISALSFAPAANWNGTTSFEWNGSDGTQYAALPRKVNLILTAQNDPPVSVPDSYTLNEGGTLSVTPSNGVLSNDTDVDGNSLTAVRVTHPIHGTLTLNANGSFTYIHDGSETLSDSFTYKAHDGSIDGNTVSVTLTINPVNDPPVVTDFSKSGQEDNVITFALSDFTRAFTDIEGNSLNRIRILNLPSNGALSLSGVRINAGDEIPTNKISGISFTPDPNWNGSVTFDWNGSDGTVFALTPGKVNITVTPVNDPPVITDLNKTLAEDEAVPFSANDFRNAFSDVDGNTLSGIRIISLPLNGTVLLSGTAIIAGTDIPSASIANLTFVPASNWNGTTSFDWNGSDGQLYASTNRKVNLVITPVNDPPVISVVNKTGMEDNPIGFSETDFSGSFTDVDGNSLSRIKVISLPPNGILRLSGTATSAGDEIIAAQIHNLVFTPSPDWNGSTGFSWNGSDGVIYASNPQVVTIRVNSSNDVPVSADDSYMLNEGATLTLIASSGVLANDTDPEGSPLTSRLVTDPKHGTILLNPDGSFTYIHDGSESISDSLSYRANDGTDNGNTAMVRFKIVPVNDPPVSIADRYTLKEGEKIEIVAPKGALVNDLDAEGSKLTAIKLTDPVHGQLIFNSDGGFSYQHDGSESVADSFFYKANDGIMDGNRTVIYFSVAPVNDSPVSVSDFYRDNENDTLQVNPVNGLLSNDTDEEGDKLTAIKVTDPLYGKLLLNRDGSFTYMNDGSEETEDRFTYRASDGQVEGNIATVIIALNSVNDPPLAEADSYIVEEGGILAVTPAQGILVNDKDPEGSSLKAEKITDPFHGKLTLNTDGSFIYIHDGSETSEDSFTYRVNDGILESNRVKVTIAVTPVNDSPVALADAATIDEDTKLEGKSVLSNDSDPENDSLSVLISPVSGPSHGDLVIYPDGTYSYTPALNFNGTDNFVYQICDKGSPSKCSTAQVTITIIAVNDVPVAVDHEASVPEHQVLNGSSLLANATDPDGDLLIVSTAVDSAPLHGSLKINTDGTYLYTPNAGYSGDDSFVYRICDNAVPAACSSAKVIIHVKEINDPPVAVADQAVVNEDEILQGASLLSNDSDPEGNTISIDTNPVVSPLHGQVTIHQDGTFTYTPFPDFNGRDTFTYRVCDNGTPQACSTAIVSITINAVEDNPIAVTDNFDLKENQSFTGNLLVNDSNPDTGNLSINKDPVVAPVHGTLRISDNGDFTYKPDIDFIGTDSFTYQIYNSDKPFLKATATVIIKVEKNSQCQVFVPNSFSPNGDGIHDLFKIRCLYNYDNPVIEIFNRWGSLVYKKEHYGDKDYWGSEEQSWWDGQSDHPLNLGRNLPAGTYYYVLTIQKSKVITGFIYLNR